MTSGAPDKFRASMCACVLINLCFSTLRPEQFQKVDHPHVAVSAINTNLSEVVEVADTGFLEEVWGTIEEVINIQECEVYSYIPGMDADPFTDGTL